MEIDRDKALELVAKQQQEEELISLLGKLLKEGKASRKKLEIKWKINKKFYDGDQFLLDPEKPSLNVIRQVVMWQLSLLTDGQTKFSVLASSPEDYKFSQIMSKLVDRWYEDTSADNTITESIIDALIYDIGILKPLYDTEKDEVSLVSISPFDIYLPSGAVDFNKKCPWVIHRCPKTLGWLKRKYGSKADQLKPDYVKDTPNDKVTLEPVKDRDFPSGMKVNDSSSKDERELVDVYEVWMDDYTTEEYMLESADGTSEVLTRPKYPHGRVVLWAANQNVILDDYENPYAHGLKPFVRIVNGLTPRSIYGEGEVNHLIMDQKLVNLTIKSIQKYLEDAPGPSIIFEKGAGLTHKKITNYKSKILEVEAGKLNAVKFEYPANMPNFPWQFFETLKNNVDRTAGMSEISQGRSQANSPTAGIAIAQMLESSFQRIRVKERYLKSSLAQLGRQVVSLMMQFYDTKKMIKVSNQETGQPTFVEFWFSTDDEDNIVLNKNTSTYNKEIDGYNSSKEIESVPVKKGIYDVSVETGTGGAFNKIANNEQLKYLLENQILSPKLYVKSLDLPQKESIIKELEQREANSKDLEMRSQQQQQQGTPVKQ